jgi:hypothetical protein
MKREIKKAIEEYQCSGCVVGHNTSCFEQNEAGVGCGKHVAGTIMSGVGTLFLGMPKGFNRLGVHAEMKPIIFDTFASSDWQYNKFNIPAWKYLFNGHTFVRGMMPRRNEPFLHVFLEDCLDKIDCRLITQDDTDQMD